MMNWGDEHMLNKCCIKYVYSDVNMKVYSYSRVIFSIYSHFFIVSVTKYSKTELYRRVRRKEVHINILSVLLKKNAHVDHLSIGEGMQCSK